MKIADKVIEEAVIEVIGRDAIALVKALKGKKNVSEFTLSELIKKEIHQTRNILYRLQNAGLLSSTRKKDKKKGWYIYYWTINIKRLKSLYEKLLKEKLAKLKEQLEQTKKGQFFICPNKCTRFDFDKAMDFEFRCPECGTIVVQEDTAKRVRELERRISKIEKELEKIQSKRK